MSRHDHGPMVRLMGRAFFDFDLIPQTVRETPFGPRKFEATYVLVAQQAQAQLGKRDPVVNLELGDVTVVGFDVNEAWQSGQAGVITATLKLFVEEQPDPGIRYRLHHRQTREGGEA